MLISSPKERQSLYLQKSSGVCPQVESCSGVHSQSLVLSLQKRKDPGSSTLNEVVQGGGSQLTGKINIYLLQLVALWMSHHAGCKGIELVGRERVERGGRLVVEGGGERQRAVNTVD